MSWDKANEMQQRYSGGSSTGKFINLKDGDSFKGVFCGDPLVRQVVWNGSRTVPYDPSEHLEKDSKAKFALNVYDVDAKTMRIFEMSSTTFGELSKVHKANGESLANIIVSVSRRGSDKSTIYWVAKVDDIGADDAAKVAEIYASDGFDLEFEFELPAGTAIGPGGIKEVEPAARVVSAETIKSGSSLF